MHTLFGVDNIHVINVFCLKATIRVTTALYYLRALLVMKSYHQDMQHVAAFLRHPSSVIKLRMRVARLVCYCSGLLLTFSHDQQPTSTLDTIMFIRCRRTLEREQYSLDLRGSHIQTDSVLSFWLPMTIGVSSKQSRAPLNHLPTVNFIIKTVCIMKG